jgi:hypothetical protein
MIQLGLLGIHNPNCIMGIKMQYEIESLKKLFIEKKILPLPEIMEAIGTSSRITAARKLSKLNCISSYTNCGRYYTISTIPQYDSNGIWSYNGIFFSEADTLNNTVANFVKNSAMGYFSAELDAIVYARTANSLTKLIKDNILLREQINNKYLYLWPTRRNEQLTLRKTILQNEFKTTENEILGTQNSLRLFLKILNEKQRRLFLGYESLRLGKGGDIAISILSGANIKTVAKGRRELINGNVTPERIRKAGAGRPGFKKTKY